MNKTIDIYIQVAKSDLSLGRRQAVRHRFLESAFVGSNPTAPAKLIFTTMIYKLTANH